MCYRQESRLDVLINSAGVMRPPIEQLTKHGHDLQFGTNVLGHFYLTQLLLPTLIASAKASPDGISRVVNVSSTAHLRSKPPSQGGPVDLETVFDSEKRTQLGTGALYSQSKSVSVSNGGALQMRHLI